MVNFDLLSRNTIIRVRIQTNLNLNCTVQEVKLFCQPVWKAFLKHYCQHFSLQVAKFNFAKLVKDNMVIGEYMLYIPFSLIDRGEKFVRNMEKLFNE